MEFTDLAIEAVVVALSALAGSAFMWMTIGPWVARKGMRDFTMEAYDLDEEDVSDPKRMMKAITKEQGKIVAQSIYGALGNIVQGAPTEELMQMGSKLGIVGNGVGGGMEQLLGMLNTGNGNNAFSGLVQMILALKLMASDIGASPAQMQPQL